MKNRVIDLIKFLIIIVLFYGCMMLVGITCPIKYMTGISCPGCGMTRAIISVLHLNFSKAFYNHPLYWCIPVILGLYVYKPKINKKLFQIICFLFIILFIAVYLYRMFCSDHVIVSCNIETGLIYKIIQDIVNALVSFIYII